MTDLSVAWTGGTTYTVYSPSEEGHSNAYSVDIDALTCECDHADHQSQTSTAACKHIREAIKAHKSHPDFEHSVMLEWAGVVRDANAALSQAEELLDMAEVSRSAHAAMHDEADSEAAEGGSQADEDTDGVVTEATPSDDQQALMDDLKAWFGQAGGFNDFDPSIISLEWVKADGVEGIHVDRQPFDGGYYDDGEWQDQDAFDEHKETVKETVLSPREAFEWYGEPDYAWFIAEDDVSEVLE